MITALSLVGVFIVHAQFVILVQSFDIKQKPAISAIIFECFMEAQRVPIVYACLFIYDYIDIYKCI